MNFSFSRILFIVCSTGLFQDYSSFIWFFSRSAPPEYKRFLYVCFPSSWLLVRVSLSCSLFLSFCPLSDFVHHLPSMLSPTCRRFCFCFFMYSVFLVLLTYRPCSGSLQISSTLLHALLLPLLITAFPSSLLLSFFHKPGFSRTLQSDLLFPALLLSCGLCHTSCHS